MRVEGDDSLARRLTAQGLWEGTTVRLQNDLLFVATSEIYQMVELLKDWFRLGEKFPSLVSGSKWH